MKTKAERYQRDVLRTKRAYGLDDEQMNQYLVPTATAREKTYKNKIIRHVGRDFYERVSKWYQNLSPRERRIVNAKNEQEILEAYIVSNPDDKAITREQIEKVRQTGKIRDDRYDLLGPAEYDAEGQIRPGKKIKLQKEPPRQPTPAELSKMSVREIADLIVKTRDALWPKGGADSEVPGIDSIKSESK